MVPLEATIVAENEFEKMVNETTQQFDGMHDAPVCPPGRGGGKAGSDPQPKALHDPRQAEPLDLSLWTVDRFRGEPEEPKYLVDPFIPLGLAGTVYGMGGAGKSTLILDLSVRIAVADAIPSKWLDSFDVRTGGKVLYISAEEPEARLHMRALIRS